ncbi:hypothetical protein ACS0TY_000504 [Phlomoides rotata]
MLLKGMKFDTAHFITDVSGKYPRLWALKGAHSVTVNRWYKFGVLASIRTIAPGFREISELPDWDVFLGLARDCGICRGWQEVGKLSKKFQELLELARCWQEVGKLSKTITRAIGVGQGLAQLSK